MSDQIQESEKPLTQEEINQMREEAIQYYTERIDMLELQAKHQQLLADIEESKLRELSATIRIAQLMRGPVEKPADNSEKPSKRELKKD